MKRLSLQWKITLLVGLITVAACVGITANSVFSAPAYYSALLDADKITQDTVSSLEEYDYDQDDYDSDVLQEESVLDVPEYYADTTRLFSIQSLLVMVAIVLLALGLTYIVTGRILRPLNALNGSVRQIGGENLHERIPLPKSRDEVEELTRSFNGMLERLEEAFLVQKNFAANAAHELKTPLAVMKTSLQVLELDEEPSPGDYREFAGDVKQSLERLSGTVESLVDLTNASAGPSAPVDLRELLDQAAAALEPGAAAQGVSVTLAGGPCSISGNRTLLFRVLFNLLENAVKYNREGGSVSASVKEEGQSVLVEVRDTGIGIPKEAQRHIFEPFYRADASRSQKIPGSGLGLSIVKTVLDRCGGLIQVESREGGGTTVRVRLPREPGGESKEI